MFLWLRQLAIYQTNYIINYFADWARKLVFFLINDHRPNLEKLIQHKLTLLPFLTVAIYIKIVAYTYMTQ
jgi:hypothetical protein